VADVKRRFSILLDVDHPVDEDELMNYIVSSVNEMRGCYAPDDPVHAVKVLAVESYKSILETVDPSFGYGYLGDGEFRNRHYG
jgi:hypothetical protein